MSKYITIWFLLCFYVFVGINSSLAQNQDGFTRDLEFTTISKTEFTNYETQYQSLMQKLSFMDTNNYIKALDLNLISNCNEICEAFLQDPKTGEQIWLPSNYDAGLLGFQPSPEGKKIMLFSAYDGPEFEDYYDYRSEIIVFVINTGTGIQALKKDFEFTSNDWSIDTIVWIDEQYIALKVYSERRWGDGKSMNFIFLKTKLY